MTVQSRKAFKLFKSLDRDQIQFVLDKKMEGKNTVDEWLNILSSVAQMDTYGDDARDKSGNLAITFGIFMVFTIVLTISKPILFFFPIGFTFLFLYFLLTYIRLSRIDVGNHLRLFIVPLLETIKDSLDPDTKIFLKMDFSMPVKKANLIQHQEHERIGTITKYRLNWMNGEIEMKFGQKLKWDITDEVKEMLGKIEDKATKMKLNAEYDVSHLLNFYFFAPKGIFNPIDASDKSVIEQDEYYVFNIQKKDTSKSLQEGMEKEVFLEALDEANSKFNRIEL